MPPWRNWYHVTGNTYGTWLPGDPRGWTTRHHRDHIDPPDPDLPPSPLHAYSKQHVPCEPVTLSVLARAAALDAIVFALHFHKIELIVAAVDNHHFHILARFPDRKPRKWAGIAKKESARALSKANLTPEGGVWAVRTHCNPITDREHQLNVVKYIIDHELEGAVVWALWRQPKPPPPPPAAEGADAAAAP